jgi:hypothetical protein
MVTIGEGRRTVAQLLVGPAEASRHCEAHVRLGGGVVTLTACSNASPIERDRYWCWHKKKRVC